MVRLLRRRYVLALAGVIVLAVAGSMAYVRASGQAPCYRTVTVGYGTVTQTLSMSGNLAPAAESNLNFAVAGAVSEVDVEAGQKVSAGQVLAKPDTTALQGTLTDAHAKQSNDQPPPGSPRRSSSSRARRQPWSRSKRE